MCVKRKILSIFGKMVYNVGMEKTVNKKEIFKGKVLHVFCDDALSENGTPCVREYLHHPGGVCVLAVNEQKVAFVRQYRYALSKHLLELPAGKLEHGEDPYAAGCRELTEETGFVAEKLIPMGTIIPTCGYSDEVIYLYLASGLKKGTACPDADECLDLVFVDFDQAVSMAKSGEITDAKSVVLLLKADTYFKENKL